MSRPTFECPHCGADVPAGRRACAECGSDARTGWQDQQEIDYQSLDIPQGWGPGDAAPVRGSAMMYRWLVVGLALVMLVVWLLLAT